LLILPVVVGSKPTGVSSHLSSAEERRNRG
jgi:hypothetical protein